MTAAAALARLRELGVTAEVRGDRLILRPASAVPSDLLADLRTHKDEVLALLAANDAAIPPTLPPASPKQATDEAADRAAIEAEPLLPAPCTPERDRLDRRHAGMVAGLLAMARTTVPQTSKTTTLRDNAGDSHGK